MDELVTFIVPVYNVEPYLKRCVDSITGQTHTALQIILIDDGSPDGSGTLCDALAAQDTRIEVIHQANGGVSVARNAGLDRVRGGWITFVDSDDYISPYFLEDLLSAAHENCDISICSEVGVAATCTAPSYVRVSQVERLSGYEACVHHFGKEANLFNKSSCKLFRASLWNELRFPVGKVNEDVFVSHTLLYSARSVAITNAVLYAYVMSDNSIMRSTFTVRRLDILDAWEEAIRFYSRVNEPELTHIARRVYCSRVLDACCICRRELPNAHETLRLLGQRAAESYRDAQPLRGYIDCSWSRTLAYRFKFFLGRWALPLYHILFVRGRAYI